MKSKSIFPYPLAVLTICLWLILLNVPLALAQGNYVPLAPIDVEGSEFTSPSYTYPDDTRADKTCVAPTCFPRYLRTIYNIGIALAGFFAVFSIVRGGFELLFTDSILGHTEAKGIILRAIGGLIVVYSSYILLNTINPQLARDLSLSFKELPPPTAAFGDLPPLTAAQQKAIDDAAKVRTETGYGAVLDQRLVDINTVLANTKATARQLEEEAKDLELELDTAVQSGAIVYGSSEYYTYKEKIESARKSAQAVRDFDTAKETVTNARLQGIHAATTGEKVGSKRIFGLFTVGGTGNADVIKQQIKAFSDYAATKLRTSGRVEQATEIINAATQAIIDIKTVQDAQLQRDIETMQATQIGF